MSDPRKHVKPPHVWVIEADIDGAGFLPCAEVSLTRTDANEFRKYWIARGYRARVKKYVRSTP